MLNNLVALPSLRGWRRRVIGAALGFGLALGFAAGVLRGGRTVPLIEACRTAAAAAEPDRVAQLGVANVCLRAFMSSLDPASGARAGRALSKASLGRALVEALAAAIGDEPGGADAWLAVGNDRRGDGDPGGAITAYHRALVHRHGDVVGTLRDNNGLVLAYQKLNDYQNACVAAATAYDLLSQDIPIRDRRVTLLTITSPLINLGNVETAKRLLEEAQTITTSAQPEYAALQEKLGFVEQALHHPLTAKQAYRAAMSVARTGADRWALHMNLLRLALDEGDVAEARILTALAPRMPDLPDDRAAASFYQARLLVAQGRFLGAAELVERAMAEAPPRWAEQFDGLRGHALRLAGGLAEAEPALLRAVTSIERRRRELDNDTLKSWMLAQQRAPFEDLFLLYVAQNRLLEALTIAQRATARSYLDGLINSPVRSASVHDGILAGGARADAVRSLLRSTRSSRSADIPPVTAMLDRLHGHHIVTYFQAGQELWAIVIQRDSTLLARRIGPTRELARAVSNWQEHPERLDLAEQLGMWLLPVELAPEDNATLYVIPDASVRAVTFASLRRNGAYVVEHNAVTYGLSAASLAVEHGPPGRGAAVVIGDPLGDLPSARVEATEVAQSLGVTPYLGRAATRSVVERAVNAVVLHIAAHTDALSGGPAIHLADRPLDTATVLETPSSIPLVVLLGCSSARAKDRDELAPLATAFLAAGAHTVVASLWAVDDKVGRDFARELYRSGATEDPIRALATAQRQLLRDGVPANQWSTFVVFGGLGSNLQRRSE